MQKPGTFHLPWNGHPEYWLCAMLDDTDSDVEGRLHSIGMRKLESDRPCFVIQTEQEWQKAWEPVHAALADALENHEVKMALIPGGGSEPSVDMIRTSAQPARALERIAENIWLGEALQNHTICCYFQPIVDRTKKPMGYESFARIERAGQPPIGGQEIIDASHILNIEHVVDRYLHKEAVQGFRENCLDGTLFMNFIPGFIHRPSIYLQGLNEAVDSRDLPPGRVAIDFTRSDSIKDLTHFRSVISYCRAKGYQLALDDIPDLHIAKTLVEDLNPHFVKLDRSLCLDIIDAGKMDELIFFVRFAHAAGCKVVAEGVETESMFTLLQQAEIDLFQGFFFSPPVPGREM